MNEDSIDLLINENTKGIGLQKDENNMTFIDYFVNYKKAVKPTIIQIKNAII